MCILFPIVGHTVKYHELVHMHTMLFDLKQGLVWLVVESADQSERRMLGRLDNRSYHPVFKLDFMVCKWTSCMVRLPCAICWKICNHIPSVIVCNWGINTKQSLKGRKLGPQMFEPKRVLVTSLAICEFCTKESYITTAWQCSVYNCKGKVPIHM